MGWIYLIRNDINRKKYIGKTEKINPNERWREHKSDYLKERYKNRPLYKAMRKYGIENFSFSVLEQRTDADLSEREKYYIKIYNTFHYGYNATLGGDGNPWLALDEEAVCTYYETSNLAETARHFGCDPESITKILYRNGVTLKSSEMVNLELWGKKVVRKDLKTGQVLDIYDSTREAEKHFTNKDYHGNSISRVCRGERKQAYGFAWEYLENCKSSTEIAPS